MERPHSRRQVTVHVPPDPPRAAALRGAGADVVMSERVASHGDALWQAEFPLMVAWAFGR